VVRDVLSLSLSLSLSQECNQWFVTSDGAETWVRAPCASYLPPRPASHAHAK